VKLLKFKGGSAGVPLWINADAVSAVELDRDPDRNLTLITTLDGKEHRVQETPEEVVTALQS